MTDSTTRTAHRDPSRRQAIRMLAGGVAALAMGACTPATIVLKAYPEDYRPGSKATDEALRGFLDTVVPGLTPDERRLVTVLEDPFYPLAKYSAYLASDLDGRSKRRYRSVFAALTPVQRASVIRDALSSRDRTTRKLYTGAVFLTQAAVYAGISDDRAGCRLIDFPGGGHLTANSQAFPGRTAITSRAQSPDGNPA
jgi:hypothetical protein